jgi:nucleotide-binding universal stress UspA family protein
MMTCDQAVELTAWQGVDGGQWHDPWAAKPPLWKTGVVMKNTLWRKPGRKSARVAPTPTAVTPVDPTYPFRNGPVLLATDGTEESDAPLIAARALAARLHLPLEVVSVLEPMPIYAGSGDAELPLLMEADRRLVREASVRRYVDILTPAAERWRFHLRCGSTAHEIAAVARERTASVVVVGASPHRRFGATVAGARAAQVLRRVDCPVLSVAPDFTGWPVHAVVGVDFAAPGTRAAEATLRLLEDGATLTLVHVLRVLPLDPVGSDVLTTRVRPRARTLLSHLCTALAPRAPTGVTVRTEIIEDGVEIGLIEYSQRRGAGLIAVGTHGPNILERLFVGSSAVTVLHAAQCSVLACPPPPAADRIQLLLEATDTVTAASREDWATLLDDISARNTDRTVSV